MNRAASNIALRPAARGLTLLELILSLALVAMVGLGIASMLAMVGSGASVARDARSALQRTHAAQLRLSAYIRPALALLQVDNAGNRFMLWLHDDRPGGRVNLTELRLFEIDSATGSLTVSWVEFPGSWTLLQTLRADKECLPGDNFFQKFATIRSQGNTRSTALCDNVVSVGATFATGKPIDAHRFGVNLTVARGSAAPLTTLLSFGLPSYTKPS